MAFNKVGFFCIVLLFTVRCNTFHVEKVSGSASACSSVPICAPCTNTSDISTTRLNYATQNRQNTHNVVDRPNDYIQINLADLAMNSSRKIVVTVREGDHNAIAQQSEDDPYISGVVVRSHRKLTVTVKSEPDDRTIDGGKPETPVSAQPIFRPDYKFYPGYGFYKYHCPSTWIEARRICNSENAHLPIVDTAAKAKMLIDIYHAQPRPTHIEHPEQLHIGMHDLFKEGHFVTIFDEPLDNMKFQKWAPGNPSDSNDNEDCGTLREALDLNDYPCTDLQLSFICEKRLGTAG